MPHFFAYGARMNPKTMQDGAPNAVLVGPARLDGFRLAFNVPSRSWGGGAANAVPALGSHMWGVLWQIDEGELEPLNSYRGEEHLEHVLEVEVAGPDGPVTATTFAVDSPEVFVSPAARYLDMLRAVARDQGLPEEALADIDAAATGAPRGSTPSI